MMSDYDVTLVNDNTADLYVIFHGPKDSPYAGGSWKVHVELPEGYPYKSPSIGFCNRMFHPNVDEMSGTVCLDVINQSWSPMFDLLNVFEVFLPQLLLYPNPTDPLNGEAAALMMREPENYEARIRGPRHSPNLTPHATRHTTHATRPHPHPHPHPHPGPHRCPCSARLAECVAKYAQAAASSSKAGDDEDDEDDMSDDD